MSHRIYWPPGTNPLCLSRYGLYLLLMLCWAAFAWVNLATLPTAIGLLVVIPALVNAAAPYTWPTLIATVLETSTLPALLLYASAPGVVVGLAVVLMACLGLATVRVYFQAL